MKIIKVSEDTHKKLSVLKAQKELVSLDKLIELLIENYLKQNK